MPVWRNGRRAWFRSRCPSGRPGSSPGAGTRHPRVPMVMWPNGEAAACKAVHAGSSPVVTSQVWREPDCPYRAGVAHGVVLPM